VSTFPLKWNGKGAITETENTVLHLQSSTTVDKVSFYKVHPAFSLFIYFVALGFELRAYTLSHSTSPFL
jgi:hypothetical protein